MTPVLQLSSTVLSHSDQPSDALQYMYSTLSVSSSPQRYCMGVMILMHMPDCAVNRLYNYSPVKQVMITGAVPPVLHEESYGLPAFARDYNSDYQTVLRRRDDWNPIVSGDISTLASRAGRVVVGVDSTIAVKYTCFDNRGEF